jgi:hypothetical protein
MCPRFYLGAARSCIQRNAVEMLETNVARSRVRKN